MFMRPGGVVVLIALPDGTFEVRDTGTVMSKHTNIQDAGEAYEQLLIKMESEWEGIS
jgi:hypothetical protein